MRPAFRRRMLRFLETSIELMRVGATPAETSSDILSAHARHAQLTDGNRDRVASALWRPFCRLAARPTTSTMGAVGR